MQIRSIEPLATVESTRMEELYCAENKIAAIEGISHLTSLSVLELGSNRIKVRNRSAQVHSMCTTMPLCSSPGRIWFKAATTFPRSCIRICPGMYAFQAHIKTGKLRRGCQPDFSKCSKRNGTPPTKRRAPDPPCSHYMEQENGLRGLHL